MNVDEYCSKCGDRIDSVICGGCGDWVSLSRRPATREETKP